MVDASFALALAAGMLAAVNPCGFAMLPAYVSLLVVGEDGTGGVMRPVGRALVLAGAMTLGFGAVFGGFGLLAAAVADWLVSRLPWVTVVIGVVLSLLGLWLIAGRELPSPAPKLSQAPVLRRQFTSMVLFGVSFAIASLGCTIGPFLLVVVTSFRAGSIVQGMGHFIAYAAGMALVVGTVALAVALARQSVVRHLRGAGPWLSRAAGVLMLAAGAYVGWYGWYELRLNADPATTDPLIDAAGNAQTWLAGHVDRLGAGLLGLVAAGLIAAGVAIAVWRRRPRVGDGPRNGSSC